MSQYATRSHWLVRRTGIADARRKQQFVYWSDHALGLSQAPVHDKPVEAVAKSATEEGMGDKPTATSRTQLAPSIAAEEAAMTAPSLATSATRLEANIAKPDDLISLMSHTSFVSTAANVKGEKLEWPESPTQILTNGYFTCPYCKILCPRRYLTKNAWYVHLIHDLQPYHCTYRDCFDPHRLYGTRQEWIDHESQHSRVWHCQAHGEEFETQFDYVKHLKTSHSQDTPECLSPEIIASAVGPSLNPYRDCPYCPTPLSGVVEIQKHITFHLERFALLTLPQLVEDGSDDDGSVHLSDSHQGQRRGRQGSVAGDFDDVNEWFDVDEESDADEQSFAKTYATEGPVDPLGQALTRGNLDQMPLDSGGGNTPDESAVRMWLEVLTSLPPDEREERFACPYQKVCPEEYACSVTGFPDMKRLKHHILTKHKISRCWACNRSFRTEPELRDHARSCDHKEGPMRYEKGFDSTQIFQSRETNPAQFASAPDHWRRIFQLCFPNWSTEIPQHMKGFIEIDPSYVEEGRTRWRAIKAYVAHDTGFRFLGTSRP
ncbi:hypothetical protein GGR52DRAFT_198348 [Hypoxylon sp. FL1284]|nr:hypothetical protein GGR52DRAFT_198348 [Hypoxylon sp. FL1284]